MKKESVHLSSVGGYVYLPDFTKMIAPAAMSVGEQLENF